MLGWEQWALSGLYGLAWNFVPGKCIKFSPKTLSLIAEFHYLFVPSLCRNDSILCLWKSNHPLLDFMSGSSSIITSSDSLLCSRHNSRGLCRLTVNIVVVGHLLKLRIESFFLGEQSRVVIRRLVSSLTSLLLAPSLSIWRQPALGTFTAVPHFFHFLMIDLTGLQGMFSALEVFLNPSSDLCLSITFLQNCSFFLVLPQYWHTGSWTF